MSQSCLTALQATSEEPELSPAPLPQLSHHVLQEGMLVFFLPRSWRLGESPHPYFLEVDLASFPREDLSREEGWLGREVSQYSLSCLFWFSTSNPITFARCPSPSAEIPPDSPTPAETLQSSTVMGRQLCRVGRLPRAPNTI